MMFPIVLFVLIFYFLIFRPQKKKQQQHDKMISAISRGDTIVTAGGFFGRVVDVLEDSYIIEIADGVKARILKSSISIRRDAADAKPKTQKQKKKRPSDAENTASSEPVEETANMTAQPTEVTEGVTPEENAALIDVPADATVEEEKRN